MASDKNECGEGPKIVRAMIDHLLDMDSLPKLNQKLSTRVAEMLLRAVRAAYKAKDFL